MLVLEDLKEMSEDEVKTHLIYEYSADSEKLDKFEILIAYESVGSWGCDSSSFFLLRDKETQELFEIHGSHCSCYGFENQFTPESTTIEALKHRVNESNYGSVFYTGGYDNDVEGNFKAVNDYILEM